MNKAFKFRIYPNKQQANLFERTFGCVRSIYNKMLEDMNKHYKKTKEKLKVTPAMYKDEFTWLKEVDSLALCNAKINLDRAFLNFFKNKKSGYPKFKSKKRSKLSYTTNYVNGNIKVEGKHLILPKTGKVKIKIHRDIPESYRLKSVTISKAPTNKYYASVLFEYDKDIKPAKVNKLVGLDYSMNNLFVASDDIDLDYRKCYMESLEKLKILSRQLSKCKLYSNNWKKKKMKLTKLHEKIKNQRQDFLHKKSRQITNAYDGVCIEDLDLKEMSQCLKFGISVMDNAYGTFVRMLDYKLKDQGKVLIKIDKWYPSTKTCSKCGHVKKEIKLSTRTYLCDECGLEIDRDKNASINIKNEGMRLIRAS